jgi:hypothetical protein
LLRHVARHVARLVAPLVVDNFASRRLVVDYFASRRLVVDYFAYATRRVPRHVARLVTRLVVDYFASRRLLIDYFAYAARPCASTRRTARCRLLRQRRAFGCLDTSRGSLHRSSSTTSPTPRVRVPRHIACLVTRLVVDYFAYATRRVPRHVARLVTRLVVDYASRRLLIDYFAYAARPCALTCRTARCRLLRLRRASVCLDTSRGSLHRSSSTTSPMPRVRVPRHIACLVTRLVLDYFAYTVCPGASARRAARQAVRRRILHLRRTSGCFGSSRGL